MKVSDLAEYHSLCQMWKTCRWKVPLHLNDKIKILDDDILETKQPRLLMTSLAYRCTTVRNWNKLPVGIRTEQSLARFKKLLKSWIHDRPNEDRQMTDDNHDDPRPPEDTMD